jgi:hypothetical protein
MRRSEGVPVEGGFETLTYQKACGKQAMKEKDTSKVILSIGFAIVVSLMLSPFAMGRVKKILSLLAS